MVSLWNIYSLIPLSLLLSLLVKVLTGEIVESTQDPGTDPAVWFLTQRSDRPQISDLARMGNPSTGPESDSLGQPLSWILSSSEDHDRQGVIGEYSDLQESTETSVLDNERATEDTTSEWTKQTTRSSTVDSPPDSHHEQTKYQSAETTTATFLLYPPQTGESRPTFPAIENKMTDSQFPFGLPGSVKSNKQDSLQPAGYGPSTERPTAAQATDRLGLTTDISLTTNGKIDGTTNAADNILYRGTASTLTEKGDHKNGELHVSKTSGAVLLDGNMDTSVTSCKTMNQSWTPTYPEDLASTESLNPFVALGPELLVPLYSDWNSALATWGFAWEAHVYGLGSFFAACCLSSVICLLGLPLRCPPGSPYFTLLHLLVLAFAGIQAFSLLYDAYSYQDRLPPLVSALLYELLFPSLVSAFSMAFYLLSLRSRMYLSLPLALSATCSALPRPGLLLFMSTLHFIISLGCVGILQVFHRLPVVILLFPQCLFVCLTVILSISYLIFYCLTQVNTKHIYRLNDNGESGESPEAIQPTICPFAKVEDWERAAGAAVGTSLCLLGCGGFQLYGILHALGFGGVDGLGFQPWPWWGYQVGCRLCEIGVSIGLSLIATHPLFCQNSSSNKPVTHSRPGSWSRLSCNSPLRGPTLPQMGGSNSPILPSHDSLSQSKPEKLVVCDIVTKEKSEALQLCSMSESPGHKQDNNSKLIQTKTLLFLPTPLETKHAGKSQLSSLDSWGLESDSTVDLRPPSPIDLSRSIDQALFSESLFSHSIFGLPRVSHTSSSLSLNSPSQVSSKQEPNLVEDSLYRTSSCGDVDQQSTLSSSRPSQPQIHMTPHNNTAMSPEQLDWKGSVTGSTQGLCNRPRETTKLRSNSWANRGQNFAQSSLPKAIPHLSYHRRYRTLSLASQDSQGSGRLARTKQLSESKQLEWDLAVQAEFVNVCKQIDALSVCSDTIEL